MAVTLAYHPISFLSPGQAADRKAFADGCQRLARMGWKGIEFGADMAMRTWADPVAFRRAVVDVGSNPWQTSLFATATLVGSVLIWTTSPA